jgi:serine/threonine protein kinase/Tol biopolymer transport system component
MAMSPQRLQQIEELYHQAGERPPAMWEAFLTEACGSDADLKREVQALLEQDSGAGLMERPALELVASLLNDSASQHWTPGTQVGPYQIVGLLGEGGMGKVFQARDTRLGREVAIKTAHAEFIGKFQREARAISSLNHPNICTLYDVGPNYLVMELVEGAKLAGPLPLNTAIDYARQIAAGLEAAHEKGIIHRDLKPANIKVTPEGVVKILDFGLAKATEPPSTTADPNASPTFSMTGEGIIVGTAAYMSPEQARGKPVDRRADIWAFGVILYELLTGKMLFGRNNNVSDALAAVLTREPDFQALPQGTPPQVRRLLEHCLRKDPKWRLHDIGDARILLEEPESEAPAPTAASKPGRWWIVAAALGIGVLGGWGVSRFRQLPVEVPPYRLQIDPPEGGQFIFGGSVGGLALSPDGRTAAFVASASGKYWLWIRPLEGAAARLIAGTEGAAFPFWSPNSKSVAFFAGGKLLRVDLNGGTPVVICDVNAPRGGTWTGDGRILYGIQSAGLFQVPESGGTPSPLTTYDAARGETRHYWPQALPGGRFLFSVTSEKPDNTGIYVASFNKPSERIRLLPTDSQALYAPGAEGKSYLLWLRGGTLVAQELNHGALSLVGEAHTLTDPVGTVNTLTAMNVAVSATGLLLYSASNASSQLIWVDRTGKLLGVVGATAEYGPFRLSPDRRRIVASLDRPGSTDLWLIDVERGVPSPFTSGPRRTFPVWSPDGGTILYSGGNRNLFRKRSSGAEGEQPLSRSPDIQIVTDWSRDGRWLLYYEISPQTQRDLWILPATPDGNGLSEATPKPYLRTQFNEVWGRFSPEIPPRWVAYQSDDSGRLEIYIQSFPEPHGAIRISTAGGEYAQWGADASELYYVSADNKLMAVSLKIGANSVEPSTPRELFPISTLQVAGSPYNPDGQRFLVRATPPGQAAPSLTVIVNWPALIKKQAPAQ